MVIETLDMMSHTLVGSAFFIFLVIDSEKVYKNYIGTHFVSPAWGFGRQCLRFS
jgi:hypothetical protein